ncbi:MAG: acyl-CoA/acyl-ACP dehydrogenase [Alicyclobacillus macrosporangiidus]|uniref:acyl-CoA dehydrogenase family protein n=1 Tax=Alicyclobacillus macrosporangiidus TaxID=392015 RepID=UPI0026E988EF|nr:acyl-CoA dehydrogenase family protein [Alicyclobacillus macrosporangiidus]MCL6598256.1 acyl-CoA/acyl-ACP dehydrogenase [Alicyclobacillus macrosporangiidus]
MTHAVDEDRQHLHESIRQGIRALCERFPESYWRELDESRRYPDAFIQALTEAGWLSMLIPEEYGGGGLGIREAAIVLEEINRSGGNAAAGHAQMYTMGALLRHGSEEQKRRWLPDVASGRIRLQAFAITEPTAGSDTTNISTYAVREGDHYRVRGQKIFVSRVQHSDLMVLLARTTPRDQVVKKTDGLSLFLLDLRENRGRVDVQPVRTMINHETNQIFFDDAVVPAENRIGEEGKGFQYLLSGVNAERVLIASECIGDGRYFIDRAVAYARTRVVFNRPIGQNQGIQFPLAQAHMDLEAATLMRDLAADLFDRGMQAGKEANMAKYLASEAAWRAANAAMTTFGGYGLAVEYNVERKFREARLPLVAPVSNNLVLSYVAEHVLGMPRSY